MPHGQSGHRTASKSHMLPPPAPFVIWSEWPRTAPVHRRSCCVAVQCSRIAGRKMVTWFFLTTERGLPCLGIYSAQNQSVDPFGPGAEAQFSPDGQWIAYIGQGGVAGGGGIVVQRFPATGDRMPISGLGGAQPRWSRDGRQIFYVAPDRKLMAVSFDPANGRAARPRTVFQTRIVAPNLFGFQSEGAFDGRFLVKPFPSQ